MPAPPRGSVIISRNIISQCIIRTAGAAVPPGLRWREEYRFKILRKLCCRVFAVPLDDLQHFFANQAGEKADECPIAAKQDAFEASMAEYTCFRADDSLIAVRQETEVPRSFSIASGSKRCESIRIPLTQHG